MYSTFLRILKLWAFVSRPIMNAVRSVLCLTQKDDRAICFCCGGGVRKWEEDDDAWEQHALYYDTCAYLRLMKGLKYIESIKEKFAVDEHDFTDLSILFQEN